MPLPLQTFWIGSDPAGGWLSEEFHAYSWALSVHSLKAYSSGAVLHTTSQGADWLIGILDLPYAKVVVSLDGYELPDERAWVMRKLHTYALQTQGFFHLDGDAYLFAPLPSRLHEAPLLAQNLEYNHPYYLNAVRTVSDGFPFRPPFAQSEPNGKIWAVNAGLVGGRNNTFFKALYKEAENFLTLNHKHLNKLPSFELNTYLEQYLFKQMADADGLDIAPLLEYEVGYPYNYALDKFPALSGGIGYLHVMNYKRNPTICEQVAQRLWLDAPDLYDRCQKAVRRAIAPKHYIQLTWNDRKNPIELDGVKGHTLLQDARDFEQGKKEFSESLPDAEALWADWRDCSKHVNELLSLSRSQYGQFPVQYGSYCTRVETEWNWAVQAEFAEQKEPNDFEANRNKEPAYYETLLYVAPHLGVVREQILDGLSILLLDNAEEANSYAELAASTISLILQHQPQADQSLLEQRVEDRLRYFLYLGVLRFMDE